MKKIRVTRLQTLWSKTRGLIGKQTAEPVFFETRFGIHTLGLRFPIDVLILDNENKVAVVKESLVPNTVFFWNPIYKKVIELPSGYIEKEKIKAGEMVEVI